MLRTKIGRITDSKRYLERKEVMNMSDFDDFFDGDFGWEEFGMLGALAEELSEEEKERLRIEQMEKEMNESCCNEDDDIPSDEEFIP